MKAPSKQDRLNALSEKIAQWQSQGTNPMEMLTEEQYDFLCDMDYNVDSLTLTPEQVKNVQSIKKVKRANSPNGYNKIYPQNKIATYNGICDYLVQSGYKIERPSKENYRDLYLTKDNVRYKIVLSVPRD